MLRVMLVDDERLARQALRQLLVEMPDVMLVAEADSVRAAREILVREEVHGIFLDVKMPREDGFALLGTDATGVKVVFVTAFSEHAVRAFEVDAVDYLLKPVRAARLVLAVDRLRDACGVGALEAGEDAGPGQVYQRGDRICLRTPGRTLVAPLEKVLFLEADGDFTRVFVAGEAPLMICQTLRTYEATLPRPPFVRLDRSVMINVDAVARTERMSRDVEQVWLNGLDRPVVLGRAGQARLREAGV